MSVPLLTCALIEKKEIVERYLLGELDEDERDAFEGHFLSCAGCFEELENHRALQTALRAEAARSGASPMVDFRGSTRERIPARSRWIAPVVVAAAAILVLFLVLDRRIPTAPPPSVSPAPPAPPGAGPATTEAPPRRDIYPPEAILALARVDPPPYERLVVRGSNDAASHRFRESMERYVRSDYAGAIPGLEEAAALAPGAPHVTFYLGACYLLAGRPEPAINRFRRVLAQGDSPFVEESRFYLAKALLRTGDVDGARIELRALLAEQGGLRVEAERLLAELDRIRAETR